MKWCLYRWLHCVSTFFSGNRGCKKWCLPALVWAVSACSVLQYQPIKTISQVEPVQGYRLQQALNSNPGGSRDDMLMVLLFSGGGTRAAAFGYGVLEALQRQPVMVNGQRRNLLDNVDLVYGISGGSILAAYYGLNGVAAIPRFEKEFLNQNIQKILLRQLLSASNWPRLTSPQFGRGDLLQEQLDLSLFHGATYGDLLHRRKGPFVVVSATDMSLGSRLDFTQDYFDLMCLDLTDMPLSRAVAASSAVPVIFAPITINNHGGQCHYRMPDWPENEVADTGISTGFRQQIKKEQTARIQQYLNSEKRPYIHLLDGGLTDNLGLRSLLDTTERYSRQGLYDEFVGNKPKKIIIINVNAQTQMKNEIDASANIPGLRSVVDAIVNIPIDKYSEETARQFYQYVDWWNRTKEADMPNLYFISVNLLNLPPSKLRDSVVHIPTTFYLAHEDVANLKAAAAQLLGDSQEYQRLVHELSPSAAVHHKQTDSAAQAGIAASLFNDDDGNVVPAPAASPVDLWLPEKMKVTDY